MTTKSTIQWLINSGEYHTMSLQQMGDRCGVTRQRVQQIFAKLGVERVDRRGIRRVVPKRCLHCGVKVSFYATYCHAHQSLSSRRVVGVMYPCSRCGTPTLYPNGFYRSNKNGGYYTQCKKCKLQQQKVWRKAQSPEYRVHRLARMREYYHQYYFLIRPRGECIECGVETSRPWYKYCRRHMHRKGSKHG